MPSKHLFKGIFLKLCCALCVASSLAYAANDEAFMQSANALFNEEKVFETESKRLMDNTHQVDQALLNFETVLMAEHKTAQALITLDNALTTIEKGLSVAEQVPQTREQAQKLKKDLQTIHKPVASSAKTMSAIDAKVVPLLNATQKAEKVTSKLVVIEDGFRHVSIRYFDTVGLVSQCEHDDMIIGIMDHSRMVYTPYPCGVKTCTQKVPYPCGVKTCHVDISMSVSDALKGADAIERKIESILSSTAYKALKEIGLGSVIKDLKNQANALVKPILSKLNLNIDTSLPKLDIAFDLSLIDAGIADIGKFEAELVKLSAILDMHSPTFRPYSQKLDKINVDIKSALNSPRCKNLKHEESA